ncbi:MAG TPA: GAF and ANTAR domain-containing protein [Actinomycetes bacterium]
MTDQLTPQDQFAILAQQLRDGKTVEEVQQVVVQAAVTLVDGCDRAAIGLLDGDRFHSGAATDDVMRLIDELQNELGEGPCLEASTDQVVQVDNDIADGSRWPALAEVVLRRTPVRAMLAVPLVDDGRRHGALNVFADRPGAFDESSIGQAAVLASFASVAVAGARHSERAAQFEEGMATNREIGAAIGILMATHGISSDEAFAMLSQASQRLNRKLRDIATGIVRGDTKSG